MSKDDWLKFFTDAGIPQKDALGYAVKFAHNRIQINMLPDLNKEYLKEMEITILGDVISILRHAKIVHEKRIKEKVLLENSSLSSSKNNVSSKINLEDREHSSTITKKKTSSAPADVPKPSLKSTVKSVGIVSGKGSLRRKISEEEDDISLKKRNRMESPRKKINSIPLSVEEEEIEELEDMGYIFGPLSPRHHDIIENRNDRNKRFKLNNSSNVLSVPSIPTSLKRLDGGSMESTNSAKMLIGKNVGGATCNSGTVVESDSKTNRRTIIGTNPTSVISTAITTSSTTTTTVTTSAAPVTTITGSNKTNSSNKEETNAKDGDDDDDDDYDDDEEDHIQVVIDDPYFPFYDMRTQLNYNRMEKHQQFKEVTTRRRVFERLGEETSQNSVTSTTTGDDVLTPVIDENISHDTSSLVSQNSVFFRLGGRNDSLRDRINSAEELRLQIAEDEDYDEEPITVDSTDSKEDDSINSLDCETLDIVSPGTTSDKFKVHLNMNSEGILANPLNEKKLSLKHRLGYNTKAFREKQIIDLRKSGLYHKGTFKKDFPPTYMDTEMEKAKKKVKFGNVTQKIIPNKEEAIRNGELPRIPVHRASVFARLGYNVR